MKAESSNRSAPQGTNLAGRLEELRLLAEYHFWAALQSPFTLVFWAIEQRKARIADRLANWGSKP